MSTVKRATLYLIRKKNKSIVLLATLTIISTLLLLCISVGNATSSSIQELYKSMGGYFRIETNRDKGYTEFVNDEMVSRVMENREINAYNGMDTFYLWAEDITLVPGRFAYSGESNAKLTRLLGNTDTSLNENFTLDSLVLKEGRHITADDSGKALISEELAQRNELKIGDSFSVRFPDEDFPEEERANIKSHTLEIVGIFQIKSTQNQSDGNTAECDMVENFIFTDTAFLRDVIGAVTGRKINSYSSGATFFVTNPQKFDSVVSGLSQIAGYDWDGYTITENNKAYQDSAVPLMRLSGFISTLVFVIFLISSIILSLVLFLWMKDRIHEIGILLSIGIRKAGIIGQHILENLMIAAAAFALAGVISIGISGPAEKLIDYSITQNAEDEDELLDTKTQEAERDSSIDITIGISELAEILAVEILIVILSTGMSSVVVVRMRPQHILSSMS